MKKGFLKKKTSKKRKEKKKKERENLSPTRFGRENRDEKLGLKQVHSPSLQ